MRKTDVRWSWATAVFAVLVALPAAGGCASGQHVQLKFPDADPAAGTGYDCKPTSGDAIKCVESTSVDPAKWNQHGTLFVIMPRECQGHFREITIQKAGSDKPEVHVVCATAEAPIE